TILSGSYMLYERHGAGPDADVYARIRLETPNNSARMDNLRAAILRPQLRGIDASIKAWNDRHDLIASRLAQQPMIRVPYRPKEEVYVGSSIQFLMPGIGKDEARAMISTLADRGVEVKWFGGEEPVGFTSDHHSWQYVAAQKLPRTDDILSGLFDMRLPLTFSLEDCALLADHIIEVAGIVTKGRG
ncbi:MAG: DegT/DnrJ/EryC1/StrS family aminotransferase, partial [Paracoccaceae bacterium]